MYWKVTGPLNFSKNNCLLIWFPCKLSWVVTQKVCWKIVQKLQELTDIVNSCDLELRVLLIDKATLDSYDYYDVTINLHNVEGITTNLPAVNR